MTHSSPFDTTDASMNTSASLDIVDRWFCFFWEINFRNFVISERFNSWARNLFVLSPTVITQWCGESWTDLQQWCGEKWTDLRSDQSVMQTKCIDKGEVANQSRTVITQWCSVFERPFFWTPDFVQIDCLFTSLIHSQFVWHHWTSVEWVLVLVSRLTCLTVSDIDIRFLRKILLSLSHSAYSVRLVYCSVDYSFSTHSSFGILLCWWLFFNILCTVGILLCWFASA